jgi:hypothetical protein
MGRGPRCDRGVGLQALVIGRSPGPSDVLGFANPETKWSKTSPKPHGAINPTGFPGLVVADGTGSGLHRTPVQAPSTYQS